MGDKISYNAQTNCKKLNFFFDDEKKDK